MIGYSYKAIRPISYKKISFNNTKMSGYSKTFKVKDGDKDENKKMMSFPIDDEKLLEKYKLH